MSKKTFDCVEMKARIQQKLLQEYETRKDEFVSYGDFLNATAEESEVIRAFRERVARANTRSTPFSARRS